MSLEFVSRYQALPINVQECIFKKFAGERHVREFNVVFYDDVESNEWLDFAKTQVMTTVRGLQWKDNMILCRLNEPVVDLSLSEVENNDDDDAGTWLDHFELIFGTTTDGRLWVDNGLSKWIHVGSYGRWIVYKYPNLCSLSRIYATNVLHANAILFKDVEILGCQFDMTEAIDMESTPPIRMRVEENRM